ncbi:hypothetical protein KXV85_001257, partial [Aspergillus fumigatus]
AHRPGARVRRLPLDEEGDRRSQSRRHRRSRADPAQRRPAGRAGHAGMGHAADPDKTGKAGRARHGAAVGRAHERHQLWRLHPPCRAGILCRRPAGAGAERRPHHARCRRAHHPSRCAGGRAGNTPRGMEAPGTTLRARLWLDVLKTHQAGERRLRFRFPRDGLWRARRRTIDIL